MNKTFTLNVLRSLKKLILTASVIFAVTANQAFVNHNSTNFIDLQTKVVKCYPNPAISFVNFEFSADVLSKNYSLQIYSFTGKKMYETNVTNEKITLTLSNDFYRGIYVYQFVDRSGRILETGKFQVVR